MRHVIDSNIPWEANCAARHLGLWLAEPHWFCGAVEAVKSGSWAGYADRVTLDAAVSRRDSGEAVLYAVDGDGIAHIPMIGPMMKGDSKFGGTNTVRTRRALRAAVQDREVRGIMLQIDSPGGTVDGTQSLASDVRAADAIKPVFAHADDLMASAAFWVGSQARQVTASETAEVGSIGTVAVVYDKSKKAEMEGVDVHVVSTGKFKGMFAPGSVVESEQIEALQERVNDLNGFFLDAVKKGRNMPISQVREAADGRVFIAGKAMAMGLVDAVQPLEKSLSQLNRVSGSRGRSGKNARNRLALAERTI